MQPIYVIKKSGEREPFSEEKVLNSMKRAGLPEYLHSTVLEHIKQRLHPEIETAEIFSHIEEFLKKEDKESYLRFNLKQAIFDLGPTGFPFEVYMSRIFESQGYSAEVGKIMEGECVKHEVDIILGKDGKKEIVEAKFHNQQGVKTEIHVLLYTYARFLDLKDKYNFSGVWVVTNTKITEDARQYASCKGIKTIGWNSPTGHGLQEFVEDPSMYPITILGDLSLEEKRRLMEENIVLCCDLVEASDFILYQKLMLDKKRVVKAQESAKIVCRQKHKSKT